MTWYVTEADEGDPLCWQGEATDAEDAGERAVESWYDDGVWAGETPPSRMIVLVRQDLEAAPLRVRVDLDWSPTFSGSVCD